MDSITIYQRLHSIENEVDKLSNTIFALKNTDMEKHGANYEKLSTDAALCAERIACRLRNLIRIMDLTGKSDYMKEAVQALGIQVSFEDDILSVTLPGLFPKRRIRSSTAFLHDPLHYALKEFFTDHEVAPFKECVICFCLVYDRELPQRRIKDYDNMELKLILDVISSYTLFDDSGLYCDDHHTTELGETDQTIIYIMEKDKFPDWLGNHMKTKNTLSENM